VSVLVSVMRKRDHEVHTRLRRGNDDVVSHDDQVPRAGFRNGVPDLSKGWPLLRSVWRGRRGKKHSRVVYEQTVVWVTGRDCGDFRNDGTFVLGTARWASAPVPIEPIQSWNRRIDNTRENGAWVPFEYLDSGIVCEWSISRREQFAVYFDGEHLREDRGKQARTVAQVRSGLDAAFETETIAKILG
jgi:hypothetical protein